MLLSKYLITTVVFNKNNDNLKLFHLFSLNLLFI